MNILAIEDSRFLRTAIERSLMKAGYSVTTTANGQEGLEIARTCSPGLILLDMMLPGIDGTRVLEALKQDPATKKIPVIVLSGLSQRNEAKMKRAGAAAYIEKSALNLEGNADALVRLVREALGEGYPTVYGAGGQRGPAAPGDRKSEVASGKDRQ